MCKANGDSPNHTCLDCEIALVSLLYLHPMYMHSAPFAPFDQSSYFLVKRKKILFYLSSEIVWKNQAIIAGPELSSIMLDVDYLA